MKANDVREAVTDLEGDLIALARDLVQLPSVTGEEDSAQEVLAHRLRDWGLEIDLWRIEPSITAHRAYCDDGLPVTRSNLVAKWGEGRRDKAALILNGHIDVVPPGEPDRWLSNPFSGEIRDGSLHGRGACDMKGGLAACAIALRAAMKLGIVPKRPILFESVVGEETGGLGTLAAIERGYRADAAVIAEPTSLHICPVQAGALTFRLRVSGKAAHGALRASGISAVEKFWPIFERLHLLEKERHANFEHTHYSPGSLVAPVSVGRVAAGSWPSTVPEELVAEGRYGVFPGEDVTDARWRFEEAVREAASDDPWLHGNPVRIEWFEGQFEPGETRGDAPILDALTRCHLEVLEREPRVHGVSYGSDLRLFTRHGNMPAVLYGPGDIGLAHAANEKVSIAEMVRAAQVFTLLIARVLDA